MRDIYRGPAVLVGPEAEYEVHAELWDDIEMVDVSTDGVVLHTAGRRSWGGELTLSTADTAHSLDGGLLRLMAGGEGTVRVLDYKVSRDGDRLEVLGRGPAPLLGVEG